MATKQELLEGLSTSQLRELASTNDADDEIRGLTTKPELVEALSNSDNVTVESINAYTGDEDDDPKPGEPVVRSDLAGPAGRPNAGNTGDFGPTADTADEASPSGGANLAGTPQSQLNQAPPMTDRSGTNIPAPNLRQPVVDSGIRSGSASTESLDPMLTRPEEVARERAEGRSTDAANRDAGVHVDEVPQALTEGPKQSDAGPELYPFPPGGDVEVATVNPDGGPDEYYPNLEVEDVVILGQHELVPERLEGRRAFILDAPRYLVPLSEKDDVWITVRTRDEVNATLYIPLAAVSEVLKGGRVPTVRG